MSSAYESVVYVIRQKPRTFPEIRRELGIRLRDTNKVEILAKIIEKLEQSGEIRPRGTKTFAGSRWKIYEVPR